MARIIHFEIPVDNPDRAIAFYSKVLGWKIEKWEGDMEYWLITTGTEGPGIDGALTPRPEGGSFCDNLVAEVESIDDTVARWCEAGGTVAQEKFEVPGVGQFASLKDCEGNILTVTVSAA